MLPLSAPVVALVGRPNCGKTTLLEQLIPELRRRGYRVGTIKHHVHRFEMDQPGKDTWRHKQAGARRVALSSPSGLGIITDVDHDAPVEELVCRYFADLDLILAEGYKRSGLPKIEVFRSAAHPEPLAPDDTWVAMVSDSPVADSLPRFSPTDVTGLAEFLVERFITPFQRPVASLLVDGQPVPLDPASVDLLQRAISDLAPLRTLSNAREIILQLRR